MATNTMEAFYLGTFADMDANESDYVAENASILVGQTFGGPSAPLYDNIKSITTNDSDNDGAFRNNSGGQTGELITYNGVASTFDSVALYNATITYSDGTPSSITAIIVQDVSGRAFLVPWGVGNAGNVALGLMPIRSVTLNSVNSNNFGSMAMNRESNAFLDGTVNGTTGNDSMGYSYTDADGTQMNAYGGNDTVNAGAGNDSVTSGDGNDLVYGGAGNDSLHGGVGNDTIYGDADNDTLIGGDGDDTLYGGIGNDMSYGQEGNDLLHGDDGDDTLRGENGNDTIYGDAGADSLVGGDGDDALYGGIGNDLLYGQDGADSLEGGDGDDRVDGWIGNDTLKGDAGNDTLVGGAGSDWIDGGTGTDVADYRNSTAGVSVNLVTGAGSGGDAQGDTLVGVENLVGTNFDDTLTGDANANDLTGGTGNDWLIGGDGADTFYGNDGDDYLQGDAGNDLIYGGNGADQMSGGVGDDSLYGGAGNDTAAGGDGNDRLDGGDGDDLVQGDAGNDSISGGLGNDTVDGGDGNDTLDGGDGNDNLTGGVGADSMSGGAGNDRLTGGAGGDTLTGGTGEDIFTLLQAGGADTVTDFDMTLTQGRTVDQFDVNDLRTLSGDPIAWRDVVVTDTNGDGTGNAILTFPSGESVVLAGISPNQVESKQAMARMGIPCFVAGTQIQTPTGWRAIETLAVGDVVQTQTGATPIIWSGARALSAADLVACPRDKPIHFNTGAIGNTVPLRVSPQHAIALQRPDGDIVFVRARHLAAAKMRGVRVANGVKNVSYHHVLLGHHGVLSASGAAVESLYPGPQALRALPAFARLQIAAAIRSCRQQAFLGVTNLEDLAKVYGHRAYSLARRSELNASERMVQWKLLGTQPSRREIRPDAA